MLNPALQLRLGQQLTMTPQLQQAIRLLQLPVMELQAQIREALESNVMLEVEDEDTVLDSAEQEQAVPTYEREPVAEAAATVTTEERVELVDDGDWADNHTTGPSETPWSGDD